jgi:SAM-dependent methyltransferase
MNKHNLCMQSLLNELRPIPGHCDFLIASGSRALVGRAVSAGWPFELALHVGRNPSGVTLQASRQDSSSLAIAALGTETALQPNDLSLFVRACIRRFENDRCTLSWPAGLRLAVDDPLATRSRRDGGRFLLEASYVDLRPAAQALVSEVYRQPLDIPWLYDPLDYEVMIPILQTPDVSRVLDLGCGTGRNAVPLENAGYEVHGVDSAAESIRICRRFVQAPERFRQASAASLPYPENHFDAVLDVGCLHMLPDCVSRAAVLVEVQRVLKPGGFLCGRALTPRPSDWLAAQPFRSEATGFTPAQIIGEAQGMFEPLILGSTEHLTYYRLLKIAS